ncbi:GNAT family N-acetyltransferase [Ktedonospora formicarum]|uniref:N-acetyltransferase n=1 Tax=Ktedonospora formicarum TaxID=2778364 RepID=A0A8J3MX34_9CHLR|nr:GNAT family N-acetyltransferase [Ktedonospora formicarum]GHO49318.1 N-acetyltransferase [Ktedonospora formicarum]
MTQQSEQESQHHLTIELETGQLILRRPTMQDGEALLHLWLEESAQRSSSEGLSQEDAKRFMAGILSHWEQFKFGCWSVYERGQDELSGFCGLKHTEGEVELLYAFTTEGWERSIANEAITASLAYGFRTLTLERVVAIIPEPNLASRDALEKAGMEHIEDIVKDDIQQSVYILTRADWASRQTTVYLHA